MPTKLSFPCRDVAALLAHMDASGEHQAAYEAAPVPGLFWVKDQGCYLMSTGLPRLPGEGTGSKVVYAEDLGPDAGWGFVQSVCGGDDVAELLPADAFDRVFAMVRERPDATLVLEFSDTELALSVVG